MRHTYRPGEPLLPWAYAIARRVRVDSYRKRQRIASRERAVQVLPESAAGKPEEKTNLPAFEDLVASLPESQREVLTMLKVNELSLEDVARATSSKVGAVKQKAHIRPISGCAVCPSKADLRKRRTEESQNEMSRCR